MLKATNWSKMEGLLHVGGQGPAQVTYDSGRGSWLMDDSEHIADDLLTSIYIYTFGAEPFKRLVIERPARSVLALLRRHKSEALKFIREFPPRSCTRSFRISNESEDWWEDFVEARRGRRNRLIECIRSGGAQLARAA